MNNFLILIKYSFLKLIGTMQGKNKKISTLGALSLLVIGVLAIIALYSFQAWTMFVSFSPLGLSSMCIFNAYITTISFLVILSVMRITGSRVQKDDNLLLSLPISKKIIVLYKTISKYIFDLFFTLIFILPFIIMYFIFEGFNILILLCAILSILLLPLLSVGITYICDFIVAKLFNKTKNANLYKSLTSVLIFIIVFALLFTKTFSYGYQEASSLSEYFADRPLTNALLNFTLNQDLLSMLIILLVTVIPFAIGILSYSLNYGKSNISYMSNSKDLKFTYSKTGFSSLLKKEWSAYTSTPIYLTNTIIGPIFILVLSILVPIFGMQNIMSFFGTNIDTDIFVGIICLITMFMCSTTLVSCCSISLEGKNLWILKSSPTNTNQIFLAKIMPNICILIPSIIIAGLLYAIFIPLNAIQIIMVILTPLLFTFLLSCLGLFINLLVPKLDWEDEAQVVKQGLSTLLTMVLGIVLSLLPLGLYILIDGISILTLFTVSICLYFLIFVILIILLLTIGKKLFNNL